MLGRLLQRDREILLQSADAVKHRVAVGVERVAGLFQRAAANQVIVERFIFLLGSSLVGMGLAPNTSFATL